MTCFSFYTELNRFNIANASIGTKFFGQEVLGIGMF